MIQEYKQRTNIFGGIGLFLAFVAAVTLYPSRNNDVAILGYILKLGSWFFIILACRFYAKAKGHDPVLGFLGLFHLIGLLILVFLKDKTKTAQAEAKPKWTETVAGGITWVVAVVLVQVVLYETTSTLFSILAPEDLHQAWNFFEATARVRQWVRFVPLVFAFPLLFGVWKGTIEPSWNEDTITKRFREAVRGSAFGYCLLLPFAVRYQLDPWRQGLAALQTLCSITWVMTMVTGLVYIQHLARRFGERKLRTQALIALPAYLLLVAPQRFAPQRVEEVLRSFFLPATMTNERIAIRLSLVLTVVVGVFIIATFWQFRTAVLRQRAATS